MHEVSSSSSELPENWIVNGHWQDSFHPLHPAPTTWGMLMWWLAANVCELRAGQCDAVMLCQEMQGVIMDTDEMQHAGCRNYACDLSWWPLLMNFSLVEEEILMVMATKHVGTWEIVSVGAGE